METVSNQRDCLQEELKLKESQLLTVQQEIDDQHEQLEAEQDVIAQLRETCIRLKDEVEEKQAQVRKCLILDESNWSLLRLYTGQYHTNKQF